MAPVVLRCGAIKAWAHDEAGLAAAYRTMQGNAPSPAPTRALLAFTPELLEQLGMDASTATLAEVSKMLRARGEVSIANRLNKVNITIATIRHTTTASLTTLAADVARALQAPGQFDSAARAEQDGQHLLDPWADSAASCGLLPDATHGTVAARVRALEGTRVLEPLRDDRALRRRSRPAGASASSGDHACKHTVLDDELEDMPHAPSEALHAPQEVPPPVSAEDLCNAPRAEGVSLIEFDLRREMNQRMVDIESRIKQIEQWNVQQSDYVGQFFGVLEPRVNAVEAQLVGVPPSAVMEVVKEVRAMVVARLTSLEEQVAALPERTAVRSRSVQVSFASVPEVIPIGSGGETASVAVATVSSSARAASSSTAQAQIASSSAAPIRERIAALGRHLGDEAGVAALYESLGGGGCSDESFLETIACIYGEPEDGPDLSDED